MKRILLKLSGEVLKGEQSSGYCEKMLSWCGVEIKKLVDAAYSVAIVVGGGNIYRGINTEKTGIQRINGDYMGMLATIMNAIALGDVLQHSGLKTKVFSSVSIGGVVDQYSQKDAVTSLNKGDVVIFGGGTGNPFFTTDTAAALRAIEIGADLLLKGTKVDGVYTKDPLQFSDAVKLESITYQEALNKQYHVMDQTAFALSQEHQLPIRVFKLFKTGNLLKAVQGEIGTLLS